MRSFSSFIYTKTAKNEDEQTYGKAVTMRDLIEEVGLDAVRYFFAMRALIRTWILTWILPYPHLTKTLCIMHNTHMHVFAKMLRQGEEQGLKPAADLDFSHIQSEKEYDLLKTIGGFLRQWQKRRKTHSSPCHKLYL